MNSFPAASSKHITIPSGIAHPRYTLLYLLLATDLAFVILYALYGFRFVSDPKFGLIEDWSYGEVFQYIKGFWVVLLLAFLAVRQRSILWVAWTLLFTYMLIDDSIQIHERLGGWAGATLGFSTHFGMDARDFGELVVHAVAGTFFLGFIAAAYRWGDARSKSASWVFFWLLVAFILLAVVLDNVNVDLPRLLMKGQRAFEDGGEQIVMSFIVWFAFMLVVENHTSGTEKHTPTDPGGLKS